jgi:hypothetical protein
VKDRLRALTAMVAAAGDMRFEGRPVNRRSTEFVVRLGSARARPRPLKRRGAFRTSS